MTLSVGKKILQSVLRGIPYNLHGVQNTSHVKFSLSNPHILDGCDEFVLNNSGKVRKYLEGRPLTEVTGMFDEISAKTNSVREIFETLQTKLSKQEIGTYIEKNNLKELYKVFSQTGEKGLFNIFLIKAVKNGADSTALIQRENKILNVWKNNLFSKLSKQPEGFTKEEMSQLYQKAFNGSKVPTGVNYDAFVYLNNLNPQVASRFDAHGLAKIGVADQLAQLNNLLTKGIDKNRQFFTAPLAVADDAAGIGAGLGTAGGHAYRDGSFIVVAAKDKKLAQDGISYVIVNDAYYNIIDDLAKRFPDRQFIRADKAADFFNAM